MPTTYILDGFTTRQSREYPRAKYEVDISSSKAIEQIDENETVINYSELPTEIQPVVEEAINSNPYESDSPLPNKLSRILDEYSYIQYKASKRPESSSQLYQLQIFQNNVSRPTLLDFDATLNQRYITPKKPAIISFSLTNDSNEPVPIRSTQPWPFNVPLARPQQNDAELLELWHDSYQDIYSVSKYESVFDYLYTAYYSRQEQGELPAHKTIVTEYQLPYSETLNIGRYRVHEFLEYYPSDCQEERLSYDITFTIDTGNDS